MRSGSIPMTPCAQCAVIPLPNDVQSRDLIAESGLCVWCATAKPVPPRRREWIEHEDPRIAQYDMDVCGPPYHSCCARCAS